MLRGRFGVAIVTAVTIVVVVAGLVSSQLPAIGAGGLLHPARRSMVEPLPDICEDVPFKGAGVDLKGWRCGGAGVRRGTLVYLHGIADNRGSAVGVVRRFAQRGFDVITMGTIERAFDVAESEGHFKIEAVSPEAAARTIGALVLLIHGSMDHETPPEHSRRVFEALHGPKQLMLVPGAGHNQSLRGEVWPDIDRWIDRALSTATVPR